MASNLRGREDRGYWLADAGGPDLGPIGNPIANAGQWVMGGAQVAGGAVLLTMAAVLFVIMALAATPAVKKLAGQ